MFTRPHFKRSRGANDGISFLAVALIAASPLAAADSKVDHVTIAGTNLNEMRSRLQDAGIATVYGGPHANHATEMALVSFPDGSYLELIALQPNADPQEVAQHPWGKLLQGNAGPAAWAMRTKDIAAEVTRLKAAGVAVSAPESSGRTRPDGVRLEWQTSNIGSGPRGTFFPFLIEDKTPRAQRVYPTGKPVTKEFRGVSRIVIAVRNLDDAIKRYHEAYGEPPAIKQADKDFGAYLALLGNLPVVLAQPLNADSWLHQRLQDFGEGPCAFVLAAANPSHFKAASKTRWFGGEISWFDPQKLGYHLGFEPVR